MDIFFGTPLDSPLLQIPLFLAALAVVWVLVRLMLRVVRRILAVGCSLLVALGILLLAVRYFT